MPDSVLNTSFLSQSEAALRVGLTIIAAALFMMLAVKIIMSMVAIARVKARKEWMVEPPIDKEQTRLSRLLPGDVDRSMQGTLLTRDARQRAAQASHEKNHTPAAKRST